MCVSVCRDYHSPSIFRPALNHISRSCYNDTIIIFINYSYRHLLYSPFLFRLLLFFHWFEICKNKKKIVFCETQMRENVMKNNDIMMTFCVS